MPLIIIHIIFIGLFKINKFFKAYLPRLYKLTMLFISVEIYLVLRKTIIFICLV